MASNGRNRNDAVPAELLSDEFIDAVVSFRDRPLDFVYFAFPWNEDGAPEDLLPRKGENMPAGPDAWQVEFLGHLQDKLQAAADDDARGEIISGSLRAAAVSGHGVGKLQDVDEPVLTPDGWRRIGDLRVGDFVATVDGTFTPVVGVFPQGVKRMYRVVMADGGWTWAGAEHLWWTTTRSERKHGKEGRARTTQEIAATLGFPNGPRVGLNHQIPTVSPVCHPERDLPVDPYHLGCWLGDGHRTERRMAIMTIGAGKVEALEAAGAVIRPISGLPNSFQARLKPEDADGLRDLGVLGLGSHERFIPTIYMHASIGQREALLQGLLDTDGTCGKQGCMQFTTTSPHLRDGVAEICRSLGGVARVSAPFQKRYPHAGEIRTGRTAWHVTLSLPDGINPFRNPSKAARYHPTEHGNRRRELGRFIERIESGEMRDAVCIQVAHPTHLYVTRDHIVTHNTVLVCWLILWFLSCRTHPIVTVTANTAGQLSTTTWRTLAKWQRYCITGPWFEWTATRLTHKSSPETWYAAAIPWSASNPEAFAGKHEKNLLLIFDEASGIDDIIWETAEGQMTTSGAIWCAFGNGTKNTGRFYELQGKFRGRWHIVKVDSREARYSDKKQIQEWMEDYGEDSDFFRVRVRGEFPRSSNAQLISLELIELAQREYKRKYGDRLRKAIQTDGVSVVRDMLEDANHAPIIMSIDVARMGGDMTVIGIRCGRTHINVSKFRELDQNQLVGIVAEHIDAIEPKVVFMDAAGYGQGAIDRLTNLGYEIEAVHAGVAAVRPREHFNKRAEMYVSLRDWLRNGGCIEAEDLDLATDLREVQYGFAGRTDALQLETKDDMRARGVASPDAGDALAYSFFAPVVARRSQEDTVAEKLSRWSAGYRAGKMGGSTSWRSN